MGVPMEISQSATEASDDGFTEATGQLPGSFPFPFKFDLCVCQGPILTTAPIDEQELHIDNN
jgi:hypothetical protein